MFVFGNGDWYNTVSYIFASDDEKRSVSKSDIINTFEEYYNKFSSLRNRNPLDDIESKIIIRNSLADNMFGHKDVARINYEEYYSKIELFSNLLRSFKKSQQFEIIRHFFIKGKYISNNDAEALKMFVDGSNGFDGLIKQYESLLQSHSNEAESKRDILNNLLRELEPLREDIKAIDKNYDVIFYVANNFHIRHNNLQGKYKKEAINKMPNSELCQVYDNLFFIIRIVWCFLQDKKLYDYLINQRHTLSELEKMKQIVHHDKM